jgi:integrase
MVQSPRVDNVRTRVLTTEEAERLLQSLKTTPNRHFSVVIKFLLFTGKRRGEVRKLEWSDIDLKAGTAVIRGETTKTGKTNIIPLSEPAMEVLREAKMLWDEAGGKSPLAFPSSTGGPYHDLNATWSRFRVKIGLMDVRIHDLRRSFGSWAVSNGVDLYTVSKLLGHSSTVVTQRVYAHLDLNALRKGCQMVAKVLGG